MITSGGFRPWCTSKFDLRVTCAYGLVRATVSYLIGLMVQVETGNSIKRNYAKYDRNLGIYTIDSDGHTDAFLIKMLRFISSSRL
jgi:hypothetical protein